MINDAVDDIAGGEIPVTLLFDRYASGLDDAVNATQMRGLRSPFSKIPTAKVDAMTTSAQACPAFTATARRRGELADRTESPRALMIGCASPRPAQL
ncbi:hypothetical protein OO012_04420 [Rhodobacteraceae bacterium KMM 6894]|nr:hypothetical protein [Rhodobacteraceae bacterium KMM 6894]